MGCNVGMRWLGGRRFCDPRGRHWKVTKKANGIGSTLGLEKKNIKESSSKILQPYSISINLSVMITFMRS